ncbi:hypothetical protein [Nannocystis sp.]|uniref:hypothetical protein n=1 Tax=Nannocystis sp. TaxID=1962667 RepID=UPI002425A84C|nr:hypothetical protein [Nannocystis sp.]MBK7827244.1 hypothetical protein [Nannocystis sp.]MBK9754654.1 hypothetical protein [Nannocystis sp.]
MYLAADAMFQVHRSESGQYVLMHPATETVVVSDDLAAGFARLSAAVGDAADTPVRMAPAASTVGSGRTVVIVAAVLPFVWLLALYLSLGRLAAELAVEIRAPADDAAVATRRELKELRLEISRVEARIKDGRPATAPAGSKADDDDDNPGELKPLRPAKDKPQPASVETTATAGTKVPAEIKATAEPTPPSPVDDAQ